MTPETLTVVAFSLPVTNEYALNEPLKEPSFAEYVSFSPDGFAPAFESSRTPFFIVILPAFTPSRRYAANGSLDARHLLPVTSSAIQLMSLSWLVGMDSSRWTICAAFDRSHVFDAEVDTYLIKESRCRLFEYAGMNFANSCRVETHASALPPVRLPPHQTGRADFPHPAFPVELRSS